MTNTIDLLYPCTVRHKCPVFSERPMDAKIRERKEKRVVIGLEINPAGQSSIGIPIGKARVDFDTRALICLNCNELDKVHAPDLFKTRSGNNRIPGSNMSR